MKRIQASMRPSCVRHCHRPLTHALPVPVEFQHQLHPLASSNSTIILHIQTKAQVDIQYKNSNTTTTTADPDRPSLHTPCSISHLPNRIAADARSNARLSPPPTISEHFDGLMRQTGSAGSTCWLTVWLGRCLLRSGHVRLLIPKTLMFES
jgi:hypothetical protein